MSSADDLSLLSVKLTPLWVTFPEQRVHPWSYTITKRTISL